MVTVVIRRLDKPEQRFIEIAASGMEQDTWDCILHWVCRQGGIECARLPHLAGMDACKFSFKLPPDGESEKPSGWRPVVCVYFVHGGISPNDADYAD